VNLKDVTKELCGSQPRALDSDSDARLLRRYDLEPDELREEFGIYLGSNQGQALAKGSEEKRESAALPPPIGAYSSFSGADEVPIVYLIGPLIRI
jgi:hypothetical protein